MSAFCYMENMACPIYTPAVKPFVSLQFKYSTYTYSTYDIIFALVLPAAVQLFDYLVGLTFLQSGTYFDIVLNIVFHVLRLLPII